MFELRVVQLADGHSDEELLRRTRSDAQAFGVFYRRHAAAVLGFVLRRVGNADVAADLTAEIFASALISAPAFRPERGSPVAWLFGIARHKIADALRVGAVEDRARRQLRMAPLELSDEALERVEAVASLELPTAVLAEALGGLPTDERSAVYEHVVAERSYEDIAAEIDRSPMVVRKRVSRGLARLRARLGVVR